MNEQECKELAAEVEKVLPETFRVSAITPHLTKNNETGEWEPDETKPWNFGIFPLGLLSDCLLVINSRSDWKLIQELADGIVTGKSQEEESYDPRDAYSEEVVGRNRL